MNRQRILAIVKRDMKRMVREPATLFLVLLFPIVLTLAFGTAFGAIGGGQPSYQVGIVNLDTSESGAVWMAHFSDNLSATQILKVHDYVDESSALADIAQGKVQAVLIVPVGFGTACQTYIDHPNEPAQWIPASVSIALDRGSIFAVQAIPPMVQDAIAFTLSVPQASALPIVVSDPSLVQSNVGTAFDLMAPGIFTYAAIFLTMTVAGSFTVDREKGLLKRISTTPLTAGEFMTSQVLSNMIIATIQVGLVFVVAYAVGFHPAVDGLVIVFAFALVMVFSLCAVGFGLITATLAKSPGAATGISFVFIMPQMFLGTFVGSALSPAAQEAGRVMPAWYVTDGLTSLLVRGAPLASGTVLGDMVIVIGTSIAVLLIGVVLFRRCGKA
jgi:ABC-type multidrug transport system permease subunit